MKSFPPSLPMSSVNCIIVFFILMLLFLLLDMDDKILKLKWTIWGLQTE